MSVRPGFRSDLAREAWRAAYHEARLASRERRAPGFGGPLMDLAVDVHCEGWRPERPEPFSERSTGVALRWLRRLRPGVTVLEIRDAKRPGESITRCCLRLVRLAEHGRGT